MGIRSTWLGTFALGAVLYFGVFKGFHDLSVFFNAHALILVFGGTMAVSLLSYSVDMLLEIVEFLIYGFYLKRKNSMAHFSADLLATIYQHCQNIHVDTYQPSNPFIKDGNGLLKDKSISPDDVYDVLKSVIDSFHKKYTEEAKVLLNIAKYPPALGLLGASTGMIEMMMGLGNGGTETIGAAMAVALTATFWGIATANFVFLPLADYAYRLADDDKYQRQIALDAFVMAKEGRDYKIISEVTIAKIPLVHRTLAKKILADYIATIPTNTIPMPSIQNVMELKKAE